MAKDAKGHGAEPTVINDEMIEAFCDAVKIGTSLDGAAKWAGIAPDTLYRWIRLGRAADAQPAYRNLVEKMEAAKAYFEVSTVEELRSSKDMKSLRWLLAVRWPERYSERRTVDHRHTLDLSGVPTEALEAVIETLERYGVDVEAEDAEVLELPEAV